MALFKEIKGDVLWLREVPKNHCHRQQLWIDPSDGSDINKKKLTFLNTYGRVDADKRGIMLFDL